jgi:hypothetical protein
MTDILSAFGPVVVIWMLPLAPMLYAALADVVEGLLKVAGRAGRAPMSAVVDLGARGEASL